MNGWLRRAGWEIRKTPAAPRFEPAMNEEFRAIVRDSKVKGFQSTERLFALYQSVVYLVKHKIPGDIVECGVYKGLSPAVIARTLAALGDLTRKIYLYDTYEGMTAAGPEDIETSSGKHAEILRREDGGKPYETYSRASLEEVQGNLAGTGYPAENFVFVKGRVEETLPARAPSVISLLRLDTDWYESTYHELKHLYPRLSQGGILIVDDYGHWAGARKAVDQYFEETGEPVFLSRIDYTARLAVRQSACGGS